MPNNNQSEEVDWKARLWEYVEYAPSGVEVLNCYPESIVAIIEQVSASEYARGKSEERGRIEDEFAKVAKYTQDCEPDGYGEAVNTSYWNIYEGQWEYIISQENTLKE